MIDDPWNGGKGFALKEVESMTLDQVFMSLTDRDLLAKRTRVASVASVASMAGPDGMVRGRTADGEVVYKRAGGKSYARQLMEAKIAKEADEKAKEKPSRRRKRR